MLDSLNHEIKEYQRQLSKGHIQKAYAGVMAFMSSLKSYLSDKYPDHFTSSLYFGYMDMTYFAFTPRHVKDKKLKVAIVFLHEACRFDAWLAGANRKIQSKIIEQLKNQNIGDYKLSNVNPGVDSIIETVLVKKPDFDMLDILTSQIEKKTLDFIDDVTALLKNIL
jgi:hypothetical protein